MMLLPKVYENEGGNYPQHLGKPKVSYSQIGSFREIPFTYGYLKQYFMGVELPQGMFARFGTSCGEYLEKHEISDDLSESDIKFLDMVPRPKSATYEREIVIDRGEYVIQGFIDQDYTHYKKECIIDFKTGSLSKKEKYSNPDEYYQTRMYAYHREQLGAKIGKCGVYFFPRKGNVLVEDLTPKTEHNRLRIDGPPIWIDTPYVKEDIDNYLNGVDQIVTEISEMYKYYLKYE